MAVLTQEVGRPLPPDTPHVGYEVFDVLNLDVFRY